MRMKCMLLAGLLTLSTCCAVVPAAESAVETPKSPLEEKLESLLEYKDAAKELFGEEGLLRELLPEGTDVEGMIDTVEEQISFVKDKGNEAIDLIKSKLQSEDGSFDLSVLEGLGGKLIAALGGGDSDGFDLEGLDEMMRIHEGLKSAIRDYTIEKNAEFMESGDVQIVSFTIGYEDEFDREEIRMLTDVTECTYAADGNVLRLLSGSSVPGLYTLTENEDGSFSVIDAKQAEDGSDWSASVEAMCAEVDYPAEDFYEDLAFSEYIFITDLIEYMDEHPEIEGIEYQGEVRTVEDLNEIGDAFIDSFIAESDAESVGEVEELSEVEEAE